MIAKRDGLLELAQRGPQDKDSLLTQCRKFAFEACAKFFELYGDRRGLITPSRLHELTRACVVTFKLDAGKAGGLHAASTVVYSTLASGFGLLSFYAKVKNLILQRQATKALKFCCLWRLGYGARGESWKDTTGVQLLLVLAVGCWASPQPILFLHSM